MNHPELSERLTGLLERGHLHHAWDLARDLIHSPDEDPSLRRVLKYGFLPLTLMPRLPASFWDERRCDEARRLGLTPTRPAPRIGAVAFPVVYASSGEGCFVVATVRPAAGGQDELPRSDIDETSCSAMKEALEAARRHSGDRRHFSVALDKPFPEPVCGASCGLAVALAALSFIDGLELDDSIAATGEVTRELLVRPVRDVDRKLELLREARPLARLLCPAGQSEDRANVPVERLDDAWSAARKPSPHAVEQALSEFKKQLVEDPSLRFLRFRGLAKIARGADGTRLPLLEFAVAPSLMAERESLRESEKDLRQQWRAPHLPLKERMELDRKIEHLEGVEWDSRYVGQEVVRRLTLAEALHGSHRLTVLGDPGAGKSVLTRLILLACAEDDAGTQARALLGGNDWFRPEQVKVVQSLRTLLPIRVELGGFAQALLRQRDLTFKAHIRSQLRTQGARGALQEGLGGLLTEGRLLLLCDGLDEAPEVVRECAVERILEFASSFPLVRILLTSRPHGYAPRLPDFGHVHLAPLSHAQRHLLIARIHRLVEAHRHPGPEGARRARHRTNALLLAVEKRMEWEQFLSNPLLLTLSALADTNAEGVPEHQVVVFEGFIQTLLQEWRSAPKRPEGEAEHLLKAWCAVAFTLVQKEQRHGLGKEPFLRMLSKELIGSAAPKAKQALNLALETGLLRESGTTIAFWHSTFAEFLAAKHLVGMQGGLERYWTTPLTALTLKFSAALMDHVLEDHDECDALARELLARDREGAFQAFHPGLKTVSDWLADGVRIAPELQERVWETWLEVLEKGPPSPLWGDFGRFAERAAPESVSPRLVARMALLDDRGVREVREPLARLVAPAAATVPVAKVACERWFQAHNHSAIKWLGAFGLASSGDWSDGVIEALGRFERPPRLGLHLVGELVRRSEAATLERLRHLVRLRFPSEAQPAPPAASAQGENEPRALRFAAACLLAVAGTWDGEIVRVLQSAFVQPRLSSLTDQVPELVRFCSHDSAVRETLLEWIGEDSELGSRVQAIVRDIAPLYEDMPERVLERAAMVGEGTRDALERLLVSMDEESQALSTMLRQALVHETSAGVRLGAARVLTRLEKQTASLHAALRNGMQSGSALDRAQWAHLALRREDGLSQLALVTLAECSRSGDERVRAAVYGSSPAQLKWKLEPAPLDAWLQVAADSRVPAPARLDALLAAERVEAFQAQVGPLLRDLLLVDDEQVRLSAAQSLFWREEPTPEAATIVARAAAYSDRDSFEILRFALNAPPVAQAMLRALLEAFSEITRTDSPRRRRLEEMNWSTVLRELTQQQPACIEDLLQALHQPGFAGRASHVALAELLEKQEPVRAALSAALFKAAAGTSPLHGFRLAWLGLSHEQTRTQAISLAHVLDVQAMGQDDADRLAHRLLEVGEARKAAALWRCVLKGADLQLVLEAAEMLIRYFPDEARDWLEAALPRLLESPVPEHRLGGACIAFHFGDFEAEGIHALTQCLTLAKHQAAESPGRNWFRHLSRTHELVSSAVREELLDETLARRQRADFAAMHELCVHRPETGFPLLASWLMDEDLNRFSAALKILAAKEPYREQVCSTFERRLSSAPARALEALMDLMEAHGCYSDHLAEIVIARFTSEPSVRAELEFSMIHWLQQRPEIWSVIRRQPGSIRDAMEPLLGNSESVQPDLVAFAVEQVMTHAALDTYRPAESALEHWSRQEPHAEQIRGWMRESLLKQEASTTLFVIVAFDRLAALAEVPASERMSRLRLALDARPGSSEDEEDTQHHLQAWAALRLQELGSNDGRIAPLLRESALALAKIANAEALPYFHGLKALLPSDEALRDSLLELVRRAPWIRSLDPVLELLEWAGLSVDERIDVLAARMALVPGSSEPVELIELLANLGCPPARLTALINQHALRQQEEGSPRLLLELAERPERTQLERARLAVTALAHASNWAAKEVVEYWIRRFAPQGSGGADLRWWDLGVPGFLSLRHATLARLSLVNDPALLDQVLVGFVASEPQEFLMRYQLARTGASLPSEHWRQLLDGLSIRSPDFGTARLAKEWLTLRLWQGQEPDMFNRWLRT
ncbi:hypothetical protein ACQKGO_18185 [Corallococcus interemptor]|uniref:hypothetical protein n=1 Tax=Corallococcus interemptor TaxID=2316720 RepID=UPI003D093C1D